jgi:tetratricopeptide (TPR) repeat protein
VPPFLLLAVLQAVAEGAGGTEAPRLQHVPYYLSVAAHYASADRTEALREIRSWPPARIETAVSELRGQARHLRSAPTAPEHVDFHLVEAAILMHAETGLLGLQTLNAAEAKTHLRASTNLFEWSRGAAVEARNWATTRRFAFRKSGGPSASGPVVTERIVPGDYYVALAAAALALGFPPTARPFAEKARDLAPLDPAAHLVFGCVAEGLAQVQLLEHAESAASAWRARAQRALRDAIALDAGLLEARLRLGRLLLHEARLEEAQALLREVDAAAHDDGRRHLARLLLGRVAEARDRPEEAARFYGRALEAWPDSQAARLALGRCLERTAGPAAARPLVAASLAASQRPDRAADPWFLYPFGPPGLAKAALEQVWDDALGKAFGR